MPTYDYECENGHRFELFQSMKDDALTHCNQCDAKARRIIGPGAGFIFKGGGFYITDYRSKDYQAKAKSESGGTAEGGGKSSGADSKADSKSEAKSDSKSASKPAPGADKGGTSGGGSGGGSSGKPGGSSGSSSSS